MNRRAVLAGSLAAGCGLVLGAPWVLPGRRPAITPLRGQSIGTYYSVKFPADAAPAGPLHDDIRAVLARIDALMSTYKEDSELALFNAAASDDWIAMSADTRAVEGDPGAAVRGDAARGRELSAVDASHRETRSDTKPTPTPAAPAPLAAFAAELARSSQALAEPAAQAQPGADIRLPTSVHSPQFVPHLAGELVMLAREGVQEARVHLHPAELGPIAVQITLDGQAAQVRLAVDSALTRDLLEQGLPTLAAAMRENGLTLAGGGVFQQPRDPSRQGQEGSPGRPGQDAGGQAAASSGADAGVDGAAGSARSLRLRAAGRIDVFA